MSCKRFGTLLLLASATLALSGLLAFGRLPAAILLGSIVAAVILAACGRTTVVPRLALNGAQSVIGVLMAHALHLDYLKNSMSLWPGFLLGVLAVLLISYFVGYIVARLQILPGSTGLWGASPGAASTMVLMSEAFDADQRLVAFMTYMRVVLVASVTTAVGHYVQSGATHPSFHIVQVDGALSQTVLIVLLGMLLGTRTRLPSAPMLISLFAAIILQSATGRPAALPYWLLAPSYVALGWVIGGRFTRAALKHAWRALPAIMTANIFVITACALLAWPLSRVLHTSYLTAYLATSPGGSDSVAVIASSLPVDRGLVMSMQILRFFAALVLAPPLAIGLSRLLPRHATTI